MTAHEFYICESEENRLKLVSAMDSVFKGLEEYGLDYSFGCLYLLYGDRFIEAEFGVLGVKNLRDYHARLMRGII